MFPLPFTNGVLDAVVGHGMYSFLDGFSGNNEIRIHPVDQEKNAFIIEWVFFITVEMMLGLKTPPATFQRIIIEFFSEYILTFMQVFLDDFVVYGCQHEHLDEL